MANLAKGKEHRRHIFVLADTHNRLPESVLEIAKGADEIWHLGDVCAENILDKLRAAGPPVTVVRGNCDSNLDWPLVIDLVRGGLKFRTEKLTGSSSRFAKARRSAISRLPVAIPPPADSGHS